MSSISFVGGMESTKRPGREELIAFAQKANEIEIGGISDLADDMGMSLLANTNKINISTRREDDGNTITLGSGSGSGSGSINFSDNLEFVNLDSMPMGNNGSGSMSGNPIELPNFTKASADSYRPSTSAPMNFDIGDSSGVIQSTEAKMSPEQEAKEKHNYLTRLQRLTSKGMGGQRMTMGNSLDEIKAEYGKLVDSRNLESSIKFQRNALMTFATGLEFINSRFNPFDVNLEGWSESVHENSEDYDEIFEELYDKYKDAGKMPPEVRLVMTLGTSAAMFHITNTYFKSKMPGMDDILRNNPELARQFATAAANQVGSGFGNFVGAAMQGGRGQQGQSQGQQQGQGQSQGQSQQGQQQGQSQQQQGQMPFNMSSRSPMQQQSQQDPTARREMRGPSGVEDILQAFENERVNQSNAPSPTIDASVSPIFPPSLREMPMMLNMNMLREGVGSDADPLREVSNILDEMQSVATSTMTGNDEIRRRRGRKTTSAMPTGGTLTLNV